MTEQLHKNINSSQSTKWDALMDQGNQLLLDGRRYRQLVKYYLSNGNTKIVTESANSEETEGDVPADVVVTEDDVKAVRAMVRNGEIPSNYSRNLLLSINGPLTSNPHIQRGNQIYAVMEKIEKIPEEEEILKYVTNYSPANSHRVTLSSVNDFINQYPTPIDFQRLAKGFMSRFDTSTAEGMDEAKIYNEAMKDFQRKVYGQKYDYYLQMLKLEDDAYKEGRMMAEQEYADWFAKKVASSRNSVSQNESADELKDKSFFRNIGKKVNRVIMAVQDAFVEIGKIDRAKNIQDRNNTTRPSRQTPGRVEVSRPIQAETAAERIGMVKDWGYCTINKGKLIDMPGRENEDSYFLDVENGLFAVFDGMGGHADGAKASQTAMRTLARFSSERPIQTRNDLRILVEQMSEAVRNDTANGGSTTVIGKIVEEGGKKGLIYTWSGDSRLYVVRRGVATQITKDQGFGHRVWNYLGIPEDYESKVETGYLPLEEGDHLLFCSDGITGDEEKDFIPNDELAYIIEHSGSSKDAANNLANRATKKDDRTAIVVEV